MEGDAAARPAYPRGHPNLTWDDVERKWKAVKFRPIMDLRKYFDRCFDSICACKLLHELGYELETEWKEDGKGNVKYYSWDIKGMPDPVVARVSRRSRGDRPAEAEIVAERKRARRVCSRSPVGGRAGQAGGDLAGGRNATI